jgi:hypothetical protein
VASNAFGLQGGQVAFVVSGDQLDQQPLEPVGGLYPMPGPGVCMNTLVSTPTPRPTGAPAATPPTIKSVLASSACLGPSPRRTPLSGPA